ncbi:hypothetical protein [Geotalea toluenoxydans]|uniref:hypothetical protein n=1 Tax=Geotalea toluenoxydans TaxID=421624 RepID=UPI0006D1BB2B|nr:hypothetical protein [Geotalea toluenoxydans]
MPPRIMAMLFLGAGRSAICPHCGSTVYGQSSGSLDYFKLVASVLLWFGLFLLGLATVFGRVAGFRTSYILAFSFWIVIVALFAAILATNSLILVFSKFLHRALPRKRQRNKDR